MKLNLEDLRLDAGITEDVEEKGTLDVGDTNILGEASVDEGLHGDPGLLEWSVLEVDFAIVTGPAGREPVGGVNVGEGDGEVDEEEVEIVQAPELELIVSELLYMLLRVEGVPELGCDD
jgi:hypothetical protein